MTTRGDARITVVIAAHGRPRALSCALQSLSAQTYARWRAFVVSDGPAGSLSQAVAELGDPRIELIELARNWGDQSGPNNVGMTRATTELVAFLNHDDLWFPDHLQLCLDALDAWPADLVFAANANVLEGGDGPTDWPVVVDSLAIDGTYRTRVGCAVPASTWLFRAEAVRRVGGWRRASECLGEPSQDWLFRAQRAGLRLRPAGALSVVTVPSGVRTGSYLGDQAVEQAWFLERLGSPGFRADLLRHAVPALGERSAWARVVEASRHLGLDPRAVDLRLRHRRRRGARLDDLRRVRGLDLLQSQLPPFERLRRDEAAASCDIALGDVVTFGTYAGGARYLGGGWSGAEPWGVWNDGTTARLALRPPPDAPGRLRLHMTVQPHLTSTRPVQEVRIDVGSGVSIHTLAAPGPAVLELDVPRPSRGRLDVVLDLPGSCPGEHGDPRRMALGLVALQLTPAGAADG